MNISERIKEMQGDFGKYHVTENNEEECKLENMIMLDPKTFNFVSKEHPDIIIGTIYDILEKDENSGYSEFEDMF
jgi:hypothetical protein